METVSAVVFIGLVVAGLTQLVKLVRDKNYSGAAIVVAAAVIGGLVGLFDTSIGIVDVTVAVGVMIGLSAAGVVAVAEKVG